MKPKQLHLSQLSYTSVPVSMYFDKTQQELASGTGFIYERNGKPYLITNWHNVTGQNPITKEQVGKNAGIPDVIVLTLQTQEDPFIKWGHFPVNLYDEEKRPDWFIHPKHKEKVDVVAIEIESDENFKGIFRPINKMKFDNFNLEISDDIYILGFPYKLNGGGHFPIWKRGSVATEPDIDYEGLPKLFVDTASRPGMSGSPVIFKRNGIHGDVNGILKPNTIIGEIQGFVGIYSGRILGKTELEAQLGIVWKKEVIDEIIDGNTKDKINLW
jgi:hypothetical protein